MGGFSYLLRRARGTGGFIWMGYWSSIDYYSYVVPGGWVPGFRRTAAYPLVPFAGRNILNMRLPPGDPGHLFLTRRDPHDPFVFPNFLRTYIGFSRSVSVYGCRGSGVSADFTTGFSIQEAPRTIIVFSIIA